MITFDLRIVASNRVFFEGKCTSLMIPCVDGEKEILAHHEAMIIALTAGTMRIIDENGERQEAVCGRGFVAVHDNKVSVVTDTAERPDEIDENRAREAKERAEERLRQKQSIREYYMTQAALSRAMARLKVKK